MFSTWAALTGLAVAIVLIVRKTTPVYALALGALAGGLLGGGGLVATVGAMISGVQSMVPSILRILASGVLAGALVKTGSAERIALLDEPLVLYRQHGSSLQHTQDKDPLAFYAALRELHSRMIARGLYEPLKDAFTDKAADTCISNLLKMTSSASFLKTYNCIRDKAIPEFIPEDLPAWTDPNVSSRIRDIPRCSPAEYIALHGPGLRDLIQWKDPVLTAQVIRERIKLLFKKEND